MIYEYTQNGAKKRNLDKLLKFQHDYFVTSEFIRIFAAKNKGGAGTQQENL